MSQIFFKCVTRKLKYAQLRSNQNYLLLSPHLCYCSMLWQLIGRCRVKEWLTRQKSLFKKKWLFHQTPKSSIKLNKNLKENKNYARFKKKKKVSQPPSRLFPQFMPKLGYSFWSKPNWAKPLSKPNHWFGKPNRDITNNTRS